MNWWLLCLLSLISGILYRCGGASKEEGKEEFPWLPEWFFNTKARDVGCAMVCVLAGKLISEQFIAPLWVHGLTLITLFGCLTTYWDFLFKDRDIYAMHGFMCALAFIWYPIFGEMSWALFGIRCLLLSVLMTMWCRTFDNDELEELGRGMFLVLTLGVFLWPGL